MSNTRKYKKTTSLFAMVILLFSYFSIYSQTASSNRFKRIDYEYDLVSGKVNKVSYQKDSADQFIHQYSYDSDNRITKVETSSDNIVWDVDTKYFYYAHGPLARTEIGNDKVQGIDYAYTLQGWIKGVNSNTLDKKRDMGQDGKDTSIYDPSNPQLHSNFAQDAFGYSLNYFKGDYNAISQVRWNNATNRFEAVTTGSDLMASRHDLHNGNISSMVTTIVKPTITPGDTMQFVPLPQGTAYRYDQLNRLIEMKAWQNLNSNNNTWGTGLTYNGMYNNKFSYDANGNILTALAKSQAGQIIDDQTYHHQTLAGKIIRNRTYAITDVATQTSGNDLLNQIPFDNNIASINTNNNYSYTEIGERQSDKQDSIDLITWTVYGKIKEVKRSPGSTKLNLKFDYDAYGNRVAKHTYLSDDTTWISSEYFIRNEQGKLMSVYKKELKNSSFSYKQKEKEIYGIDLIGINKNETEMIGSSIISQQGTYNHIIGHKNYSGTNQLGNVLTVFTDKKLGIDLNNDNSIDFFLPEILTSNDYAPFGSFLSERTFMSDKNPNSFNGKRDEKELSGWQDYGMRMYCRNERIFPTVDPITSKFPMLTPYQFASNTPIQAIDLDGLEASIVKTFDNQGNVTAITIHIDIQIVNESKNYSQAEVMGYAQAIGDQMIQSYQGQVSYNGVNVPVTTEVNITEGTANSPFKLTFKDLGTDYDPADGVLGEADKIGKTQKNNSDIYLGPGQDAKKDVGITGAHEKGHELGLTHTDKEINLMNSTDNGQGNQTNLNSKQLEKIIRKTERQQPNNEPTPDNRTIEEIESGVENNQTN